MTGLIAWVPAEIGTPRLDPHRVPASQQPFGGTPAEPPGRSIGWWQDLSVRFTKQISVTELPFSGYYPQGVPPIIVYKQGWFRDLDARFAKPYPITEQQLSGYYPAGVPPIIVYKQGWFRDLDEAIAKPFPVTQQRFPDYVALPILKPIGWYGLQYDYHFTQPYPVQLQRAWEAFPAMGNFPSGAIPRGGEAPWIDYHFTKPFNIQEQQFTAWPAEQVPLFFPPGSGKRYRPPTDYLPEPSDKGPNKPHQRPVWDRPEPPAPEPTPKIEPRTKGPPPLPPVAIFRDSAPVRVMSPEGLPTFQEYTPRNPLELRDELERARQEKDAIAALRVLGLLKGKQ